MTDVYHDRVRETGTGTSGTITLTGAVAQYQSFSVVGNGNTCRYTVVDADGIKWGTFGGVWSTGGSLSRVTTYESSNGVGAAVTLSGGTHTVFLTPDSTEFPTARDWTSTLAGPEISITTTATATINRQHVCTGTTSDYPVTLPAASGNADKKLAIRISPACTKFITIDGNGSETIDGALTRVMWAGEACLLHCDGSNWFKVAGRPIPMMCRMRISSSQAGISAATMTKVLLNQVDLDNTGEMSGTNDIVIRRNGNYLLTARLSWDAGGGTGFTAGTTAGTRMRQEIHLTSTAGTQLSASEVTGHVNAGPDYTVQLCSDILSNLSAGDVIIQAGYYASGSAQGFYGSAGDATSLALIEQPTW